MKKPGDARENRGVDDAQTLRADDAKAAVDDRFRIVGSADPASTRGVMSPRVVANPFGKVVVVDSRAREKLAPDLEVLRVHAPDEFHRLHDRREVLTVGIVAILEVAKVNAGRFEWILAFQSDRAGVVVRMRLNDGPGERGFSRNDQLRVAGVIAVEVAGKSEDEEVGRIRLARVRLQDHRRHRAARRVDAFAAKPVLERRIGWISGERRSERGALEHCVAMFHFRDDSDLVTVLQIAADAGPVDKALDADLRIFQMLLRADSGEHQQLRRVEGAAGENHLTRAAIFFLLVLRLFRRVRAGAIEIVPFPALNAEGALVVVEDHARGQVAHLHNEAIGILLPHGADELARSVALSVRRGKRDSRRNAFECGAVALIVRIVVGMEPAKEASDESAIPKTAPGAK